MSEQGSRPRRANELGPSGRQVAANVRRLRLLRGFSRGELARRLTEECQRPTTLSAISRIEEQARRVDADDLVALALALGVSPAALLLPPTAEGGAEVTGVGAVSAHDAWRWMDGQWPLGASRDPEKLRRELMDFYLYSRPQGIPPYHPVDQAVGWMRDFGETPFEKNKTAPREQAPEEKE